MINKTKLRCAFFAIFILVVAGFAFSVETEVGRQISDVYTGSSYDLEIKSNDNSIVRLEVVVFLSTATADPTFDIQIGTTTLSSVTIGDPYVWTGTPGVSDGVRVLRTGAAGDHDRFSISFLFFSYYSMTTCGPTSTDYLREITISMTGLSPGHLQAYVHSDEGVLGTGGCDFSPSYTDQVNFIQNLADPTEKRPIDVILVLDISGSMNGGLPSKISILHDNAQDFINLWATGDTSLSIPPFFDPDDHVGAVFFQSTVKAHPDPPGVDVQLVQFGTAPDPLDAATDLGSLYTAVGTKWSWGGTAMGGGLQKALDGFDPTPNLRHIILFTNGMQNIIPKVLDSSDPAYDYKTLNGKFLRSYGVPIYTIGTGLTTSAAYAGLLDDIATQTGAKSWFTADPGLDLHGEFITIFQDILRGNSPSIVGINSGIINKGDGEITHTYQVNKAAKSGVFYVTWHAFDAQDRNESAITMQVVGPGSIGTLTNTQGYIRSGDHYHIHSVGFPLSGHSHEGPWTIKVIEHLQDPSAYYHAGLIVEEAELDCRVGAAPGNYGTGQAILLRASLSVEGQPVTGSDVETVQCKVTHPRTALGTFLTNSHGLSDDDLKNNPPGVHEDNFPNAYSRKLYRLIEEKKLGNLLEPITNPIPIKLYDDGNKELNGDVKAGDGVYSARYKKTRLPGQYKFDFLIKGDHTVIGKFERNEVSSTIVRVKNPDPDKSEFYQDKLPGDKRLITVIPIDRFGNFLGPGFEKNITVESSVGNVSPIEDKRVNGTYTTILSNVPPDADPIYTMKLRGMEFFTGPITPPPEKWIFGGYFGINIPHNSLDIGFDPGSSFGGLIEYLCTPRLSVLVSGGYNTFTPAVAGIDDLKVFNVSANGKLYLVIGTFQFSIFGGGGFYLFNPGDDKFGLNAGSAAEYRLNKWLSFEAKYNYHHVFTPGDKTIFSTVQGGIRLRF